MRRPRVPRPSRKAATILTPDPHLVVPTPPTLVNLAGQRLTRKQQPVLLDAHGQPLAPSTTVRQRGRAGFGRRLQQQARRASSILLATATLILPSKTLALAPGPEPRLYERRAFATQKDLADRQLYERAFRAALVPGSGGGGGGSSDEPTDPGSGYAWSDDFGRYTTIASTTADGSCPPSAQTSYGARTQQNAGNGCAPDTTNYQFISTTLPDGTTGQCYRVVLPDGNGVDQGDKSLLSPWGSPQLSYTTGAALVSQIYFRASNGFTPGAPGTKWWHMQYATPNERTQVGLDGSPVSWQVVSQSRGETARQPVAPYWEDVNDGTWWRWTVSYKPNSVDSYPSAGPRDGHVRAWIGKFGMGGGTKIIDLSATAAAAGIPPGGTKVWCTLAEVDTIPAAQLLYFDFPDVFNNVNLVGGTLDYHRIRAWTN